MYQQSSRTKAVIKHEDGVHWVGFESANDLSAVLLDGRIIDEIKALDKPSEQIQKHLEKGYLYTPEDRWNNVAVLGYLAHALKHTDLSDGAYNRLLNTIQSSFDQMTVSEAEQFFKNINK